MHRDKPRSLEVDADEGRLAPPRTSHIPDHSSDWRHTIRAMRASTVPLFAIVLLTGCSASNEASPDAPQPQSTASSADVSKAAFKGEWPLATEHAIIGCDTEGAPDLPSLTLNVDGVVYGLNGTALDRHKDYKQLSSGDGVWMPGTSISDLQNAARALCPAPFSQNP